MKIKFLSLMLLTLSLSLTACGTKVLKSTAQNSTDGVDITRPPKIAASKDKAFEIKKKTDQAVSYEQWLKENSLPTKESE